MIIDGGLLIMLASLALMFVPHAQRSHAARRPPTTIIARLALRVTYPPALPTPQLTELVARADAALEQDSLTSGLRGISAVYRP
jgi:hypothetical protein